ncbi:unnamed protein product [Meganyctiphanes norvegica]|uniref:MBD domain-containing protein n=1 Tax=Meganyctiphanes norvegica TaxID=48144 RepID=A0AAV2PYX6_MEGNR
MNEIGSGETCDDEFECSDCDFKCTNESDIMQHSSMHQCHNKFNADVLNISPYGTSIKYNSKECDTDVNSRSHAKFSSENGIESCYRLPDTPETNDLGTHDYKVKIEPSSFEGIYTTELHQESEIGNKIIKLEDIDIKQEKFLNSSHKINDYVNIHRDQDSLGSTPMPCKNKHSIHPAPNNVNIYTKDEHLSTKTIAEDCGSPSSCQSEPLNGLSLPIKLKGSPPHKRPKNRKSKMEIKIDNSGIYIPPGWIRKVYLRNTLCRGIVRPKYDTFYYTESGKKLCSKKNAYEYAENKYLPDVDIAKLNFSHKNHKNTSGKKELKVNNNGKYIPEGWQRKVFKFTKGVYKGKHRVRYTSPLGRTLGSKAEVSEYIEKLDSKGILEIINVDKMDFSWNPRNTLGKIEIKVDNTGKYIPEGWQRKVYKFTKGFHKGRYLVRYISPFGRSLDSKTQVLEYIEKFVSSGIMELINVDKMDFSSKRENQTENTHTGTKKQGRSKEIK